MKQQRVGTGTAYGFRSKVKVPMEKEKEEVSWTMDAGEELNTDVTTPSL